MKKLLLIILSLLVLTTAIVFFLFYESTNGKKQSPSVKVSTASSSQRYFESESTSENANKVISEYLNNQKYDNTFHTFHVGAEPLLLSEYLKVSGVKIPYKIADYLDVREWSLYKCASSSDQDLAKPIVLSLTVALQPNYQGDLFSYLVRSFREWESGMLQDLSPVLFPGDSKDTLFLIENFKDSDDLTRLGNLGSKYENKYGMIVYYLQGDEVLIGNSLECLDKAKVFVEYGDG
jgi:uncharacterized protein YxeA